MATFEKYCKEANMKVFAFMSMDNCDQVKYSSILQALIRQSSLSNIQYPKSISEAIYVLSNHCFDVDK